MEQETDTRLEWLKEVLAKEEDSKITKAEAAYAVVHPIRIALANCEGDPDATDLLFSLLNLQLLCLAKAGKTQSEKNDLDAAFEKSIERDLAKLEGNQA